MATVDLKDEKARFDTRLTKEQKLFFERAARLGGYRSLTDFIVLTVLDKAKEIIAEKERVLDSRRDSEIFFNAITNPANPNQKLADAAEEYNTLLSE